MKTDTTKEPIETPADSERSEDSRDPSCSVFEIRTLRDIFELPTFEQMETCLDELATSMKMARASADLMAGLVKSKTGKPVEKFCEWPEMVEWEDDGKGEIGAEFRCGDETVMGVTSRQNSQNQACGASS